jgi:peptide/nickel transport system substrate-binding protein
LDRSELATIQAELMGLSGSPVTCQIIPPNIPGYAPHCPFTREGPEPEGMWTGPDLSEAQALVRRSGTAGSEVVVAITPPLEPIATPVVSMLRDLGYRVRVQTVEIDFGVVPPELMPPDADVTLVGWVPIYPSAAEFLVPLLGCVDHDGPPPPTPVVKGVEQSTLNLFDYCDRGIDRRMQQALDRKLTDPYGSAREFGAIDRDLVDLAPIIPFGNGITIQVVSERVGNVQANPQLGVLLPQMWIR